MVSQFALLIHISLYIFAPNLVLVNNHYINSITLKPTLILIKKLLIKVKWK